MSDQCNVFLTLFLIHCTVGRLVDELGGALALLRFFLKLQPTRKDRQSSAQECPTLLPVLVIHVNVERPVIAKADSLGYSHQCCKLGFQIRLFVDYLGDSR